MKIKDEARALLATLKYPMVDRAVIAEQLDRGDYMRLNEALEALGGKWSRKHKAHVFDGKDARAVVSAALVVGEVATAKDLGFFATPFPLAAQLIDLADVQPGDRVLEPSAGDGAIVRVLLSVVDVQVVAVEIDPGRAAQLARLATTDQERSRLTHVEGDFLSHRLRHGFDRVVMNPPFTKDGLEMEHVQCAYNLLFSGGRLVSVLPSGITSREDKKRTAFRAWVKDLGGTFEDLPAASFRESGTTVNTCVLVVDKP